MLDRPVHDPPDAEPTVPQRLADDLRRLTRGPGVPGELDQRILATIRTRVPAAAAARVARNRRRRVILRLAPVVGLAAAAALACFLLWPGTRPDGRGARPAGPTTRLGNSDEGAASARVAQSERPAAQVVAAHQPARQAVLAERPAAQVTILDVFALARQLQVGGTAGRAWDANHDGVVDRRDVDALAQLAVRLPPAHARGEAGT